MNKSLLYLIITACTTTFFSCNNNSNNNPQPNPTGNHRITYTLSATGRNAAYPNYLYTHLMQYKNGNDSLISLSVDTIGNALIFGTNVSSGFNAMLHGYTNIKNTGIPVTLTLSITLDGEQKVRQTFNAIGSINNGSEAQGTITYTVP